MNHSEAGRLGYLKSKATIEQKMIERIKLYNKNPKKCLYCGKSLPYKSRYNKFCNHSCSAKHSNTHRSRKHGIRACLYCGKLLKRKGKYCSQQCMGKYVRESKFNLEISQWKNGTLNRTWDKNGNVIKNIKLYLLNKYNNRCAICGWNKINPYTNKIPLEVHHIDGNWQNNNEDNLIILCPCCHALTKTYKGGNSGRGRKNIRNYRT